MLLLTNVTQVRRQYQQLLTVERCERAEEAEIARESGSKAETALVPLHDAYVVTADLQYNSNHVRASLRNVIWTQGVVIAAPTPAGSQIKDSGAEGAIENMDFGAEGAALRGLDRPLPSSSECSCLF